MKTLLKQFYILQSLLPHYKLGPNVLLRILFEVPSYNVLFLIVRDRLYQSNRIRGKHILAVSCSKFHIFTS